MEESLRKLALWHTRTFKPIMTHDELEPIMATLGFIGLPVSSSPANAGGGAWKEYVFSAAGGCRNRSPTEAMPRPRLPYPRIDGLHTCTYRAFVDAVSFYLGNSDISDLFHVRGMPLHRVYDRPFDKKFRRLEEEEGIYVFREGTLEQATFMLYNSSNSSSSNNSSNNSNIIMANRNSNPTISNLVPLKDIIVMNKVYVVFKGRSPSIYLSWPECHDNVNRFPGAVYRAYQSYAVAQSEFQVIWQHTIDQCSLPM